MCGDPKQCREQAAECVRLANEDTNQQSRDDFIELANVWLKLAAQLESDRAMLDMLDTAQKVRTRRVALATYLCFSLQKRWSVLT